MRRIAAGLLAGGLVLAACEAETALDDSPTPGPSPFAGEPPDAEFAEPEPEPEPSPEPPAPIFTEPIRLRGSGPDVVTVEVPDDEVAIAEISHEGTSNFAVWSLDAAGENIDLLVNTIGNYQGVRPINFLVGDEVRGFDIQADGSWRILIKPLSEARQFTANTITGVGDDVLLLAEMTQTEAVRFTHDGESNFAVWAWGSDVRDLVVNEIGSYDATRRVPAGTVILEITADGNWTITRSG